MQTLSDIETELFGRFGGHCLDDDSERQELAAYILEKVKQANGQRHPQDDAKEFHVLLRFHHPDFANFPIERLHNRLQMAFPLVYGSEIEVIPLEPRPFSQTEQP